MRPLTMGYLAGISVVRALIFFIYKDHSFLVSDDHHRHHHIESGGINEVINLEGAFSQNLKSVVYSENLEPIIIPMNKNNSFDYKAAMVILNKEKVSQDDARLIKLIRDYYIEPPSIATYNLLHPERLEFPFVDSRLNYMEGGFYIECGALNGEKGSNTLFFERVRKWNGLLIEADPENYKVLKTKNRKAFSMHACLNPHPYPAVMTFNKAFNRGRVVHNQEAKNWIRNQHIAEDEIQIQCFPLYSILLALNQLTVDFFSLDIEGDE